MLGGSQMTIAHSAVGFASVINIEEVLPYVIRLIRYLIIPYTPAIFLHRLKYFLIRRNILN